MTVVFITTLGTSSWEVPAGVTSLTIEGIGGGGGGSDASSGSSGGGGAYARSTCAATPGNYVSIYVGAGGDGAAGSDTWANVSTSAPPSLSSDGILAKAGSTGSAGAGGASGSCVGDVVYSGGNGGSHGGGGGAAGPTGAGAVGGDTNFGGGGGGGANGGTAGSPEQGFFEGGDGGDGNGGGGGGAGGSGVPGDGGDGSDGGGGGGGYGPASGDGGDGGMDEAWDVDYGAGGGGGSCGAGGVGGVGGDGALYGGGGGRTSADASTAGGQGIVVITYEAASAAYGGFFCGWELSASGAAPGSAFSGFQHEPEAPEAAPNGGFFGAWETQAPPIWLRSDCGDKFSQFGQEPPAPETVNPSFESWETPQGRTISPDDFSSFVRQQAPPALDFFSLWSAPCVLRAPASSFSCVAPRADSQFLPSKPFSAWDLSPNARRREAACAFEPLPAASAVQTSGFFGEWESARERPAEGDAFSSFSRYVAAETPIVLAFCEWDAQQRKKPSSLEGGGFARRLHEAYARSFEEWSVSARTIAPLDAGFSSLAISTEEPAPTPLSFSAWLSSPLRIARPLDSWTWSAPELAPAAVFGPWWDAPARLGLSGASFAPVVSLAERPVETPSLLSFGEWSVSSRFMAKASYFEGWEPPEFVQAAAFFGPEWTAATRLKAPGASFEAPPPLAELPAETLSVLSFEEWRPPFPLKATSSGAWSWSAPETPSAEVFFGSWRVSEGRPPIPGLSFEATTPLVEGASETPESLSFCEWPPCAQLTAQEPDPWRWSPLEPPPAEGVFSAWRMTDRRLWTAGSSFETGVFLAEAPAETPSPLVFSEWAAQSVVRREGGEAQPFSYGQQPSAIDQFDIWEAPRGPAARSCSAFGDVFGPEREAPQLFEESSFSLWEGPPRAVIPPSVAFEDVQLPIAEPEAPPDGGVFGEWGHSPRRTPTIAETQGFSYVEPEETPSVPVFLEWAQASVLRRKTEGSWAAVTPPAKDILREFDGWPSRPRSWLSGSSFEGFAPPGEAPAETAAEFSFSEWGVSLRASSLALGFDGWTSPERALTLSFFGPGWASAQRPWAQGSSFEGFVSLVGVPAETPSSFSSDEWASASAPSSSASAFWSWDAPEAVFEPTIFGSWLIGAAYPWGAGSSFEGFAPPGEAPAETAAEFSFSEWGVSLRASSLALGFDGWTSPERALTLSFFGPGWASAQRPWAQGSSFEGFVSLVAAPAETPASLSFSEWSVPLRASSLALGFDGWTSPERVLTLSFFGPGWASAQRPWAQGSSFEGFVSLVGVPAETPASLPFSEWRAPARVLRTDGSVSSRSLRGGVEASETSFEEWAAPVPIRKEPSEFQFFPAQEPAPAPQEQISSFWESSRGVKTAPSDFGGFVRYEPVVRAPFEEWEPQQKPSAPSMDASWTFAAFEAPAAPSAPRPVFSLWEARPRPLPAPSGDAGAPSFATPAPQGDVVFSLWEASQASPASDARWFSEGVFLEPPLPTPVDGYAFAEWSGAPRSSVAASPWEDQPQPHREPPAPVLTIDADGVRRPRLRRAAPKSDYSVYNRPSPPKPRPSPDLTRAPVESSPPEEEKTPLPAAPRKAAASSSSQIPLDDALNALLPERRGRPERTPIQIPAAQSQAKPSPAPRKSASPALAPPLASEPSPKKDAENSNRTEKDGKEKSETDALASEESSSAANLSALQEYESSVNEYIEELRSLIEEAKKITSILEDE